MSWLNTICMDSSINIHILKHSKNLHALNLALISTITLILKYLCSFHCRCERIDVHILPQSKLKKKWKREIACVKLYERSGANDELNGSHISRLCVSYFVSLFKDINRSHIHACMYIYDVQCTSLHYIYLIIVLLDFNKIFYSEFLRWYEKKMLFCLVVNVLFITQYWEAFVPVHRFRPSVMLKQLYKTYQNLELWI